MKLLMNELARQWKSSGRIEKPYQKLAAWVAILMLPATVLGIFFASLLNPQHGLNIVFGCVIILAVMANVVIWIMKVKSKKDADKPAI